MSLSNSIVYKDLLSSLASSIAVVTVLHDDILGGLTINSFTSVSLSPLLVLFCVNSSSKTESLIQKKRAFNINFLSDTQKEISKLFSSQIENKFANLQYKLGEYCNCPIILGSLGYLECELYSHHVAGDHRIIIGKVLNFCHNKRKPLVYYDRKYYSVGQLKDLKMQ